MVILKCARLCCGLVCACLCMAMVLKKEVWCSVRVEVMCFSEMLSVDWMEKKPIHCPQKVQWVMKVCDCVGVHEQCVCICLTGDKPCSNYCYLQSQRLTLPFNSLSSHHLPFFHLSSFLPFPSFFYFSTLFFYLPLFVFLSLHSLPCVHPSISLSRLACRPLVSNTSLTAFNLSHPLISSLLLSSLFPLLPQLLNTKCKDEKEIGDMVGFHIVCITEILYRVRQ